jgi:hypothetical protein
MTNFLQKYFNIRLVELGYPDDLTIEFSLGYSQGDGVAFYGKIGDDNAERLMRRLLDPQNTNGNAVARVKNLMAYRHLDSMLLVMRDASSVELEIDRNSFGNHYSHANCMSLSDNSESLIGVDLDDSDEEIREKLGVENVTHDTLDEWGEIWLRFFHALQGDIVETSNKLEAEGYKLIEAMAAEEEVVWERSTKRFTVRLSEVPDHDFDMDMYDEDVMRSTYKGMIEGKERVVGLKAEVLDRDTETVLADEALYGIVYATDDNSYGSYKTELIGNAIDKARGFISRMTLKAA